MSKSKEQLQQAVLDVGEQFAASMDTLLDTELRYLKYLRNRKRFHIGVRNIISILYQLTMSVNGEKKKIKEHGSTIKIIQY